MRKRTALRAFMGLVLSGLLVQEAFSAQLTRSADEMLKKLKLPPSILANVEKELQVPPEWLEKAKSEGPVRFLSTLEPKETKILFGVFSERYPTIQLTSTEASREDRTVKTLVAYKSGRILADVIEGVGGTFYMFKEAKALEDLRSIPTVKALPAGTKDPDGLWAGTYRLNWCMSYNTKLVQREDLPRKWEDLFTRPRWKGGNLALINRPNLWVLQLWNAKGEQWTREFLTRLFTEIKPQLRKEGQSATIELLGAGEFHAVVPSNPARTAQKAQSGSPVGYFCPEPAPTSVNEAVILKGSPNIHGAKIFLNWLLSREGQIALFAAHQATPVHKDLMRKEFIPFAEEIVGKEEAFRDPGLETELLPKVFEVWNPLWMRAGGTAR